MGRTVRRSRPLSILSPGWRRPTGRSHRCRDCRGRDVVQEECGVLRTERHRSGRHVVALLLCGAVLVAPLLLLQNGADASALTGRVPTPRAATAAPAPSTTRPGAVHPRAVAIASAPVRQVVSTTTTTAPPPTTTTVPPTTTTRVPPTTTTTTTTPPAPAPAPVAGGHVVTTGQVTYYDHPAGRCASPWLPFGTVVQITNPANGATVTCVVDDREADTQRSIDLSTATFALLAPLPQGVVDARLRW